MKYRFMEAAQPLALIRPEFPSTLLTQNNQHLTESDVLYLASSIARLSRVTEINCNTWVLQWAETVEWSAY